MSEGCLRQIRRGCADAASQGDEPSSGRYGLSPSVTNSPTRPRGGPMCTADRCVTTPRGPRPQVSPRRRPRPGSACCRS
jgi:hypothetical protein